MQECDIVMEKGPQVVPAPQHKGHLLVVDDEKAKTVNPESSMAQRHIMRNLMSKSTGSG